MRRILTTLFVLVLLASASGGEEAAHPSPAEPLSVQQAANAVASAVRRQDADSLRTLAGVDDPDPWLVADELCFRGRHDEASVFARAAVRRATEKLPAYVASRRGMKPDLLTRQVVRETNVALEAEDWERLQECTLLPVADLHTVVGVRAAHGRGLALATLGWSAKAATELARVAKSARAMGWLRRAATAFHESGMHAYEVDDLEEALASWESQLAIAGALHDKPSASVALNNLGSALEGLERYDEALRRYKAALAIERDIGSRASVVEALDNLADTLGSVGQYEEALKRYQESLAIERTLGNKADISTSLENLGETLEALARHDEALRFYREALAIKRTLGDVEDLSIALENTAGALESLGDYHAAVALYRESLLISQGSEDDYSIAVSHSNLGSALESLGVYDKAFRHLASALETLRSVGNQEEVAAALNNIGNLHVSLGSHDEAVAFLQESLAIERSLPSRRGIASALNNLGVAYQALGNSKVAATHYQECLQIYRAMGEEDGAAAALLNLGTLKVESKNHAAALTLFKRALAIERTLGDNGAIAKCLVNIANATLRLGRPIEAESLYRQALSALAEGGGRSTTALAHRGLAHIHLGRGEFERAADEAGAGIGHAEALSGGLAAGEGARVRDEYSSLFATAYIALLRAGNAPRLAAMLERGRAGSLRESLGSRSALETAVLPVELRQDLAMARHAERHALRAYRRAGRQRERESAGAARRVWNQRRNETRRVAERIQREAKHAAGIVLPAPDELARIQGYLAHDEALVYYALPSAEGVALVVRRDSARSVALPPSKRIREAVGALLGGERRIDPAQVAALAKLVVRPLGLSDEVKRVLVSPMGRLAYVPFSLLLPDREVAYVPSGTTYGLLQKSRSARGAQILALGDPNYRSGARARRTSVRSARAARLLPLPGSKIEVQAIADVALLAEDATETQLALAVKAQDRWRSIHFACHGLIDAERPMLSALALTSDEESDGFLTALEILGMHLPSDLVVMSACDSGKGRKYMTEGIVGLTHAFMYAGAPRVICSLWKVDDEATRALMIEFYKLWNPRDRGAALSTAAALKQAQARIRDRVTGVRIRRHWSGLARVEVERKWRHPYYWAAWVLWGLPQ